VNAELSPLELKGLLSKANAKNGAHEKYIAALEAELAIWRSGGRVEEAAWATPASAAAAPAAAPASAPARKAAAATTTSSSTSGAGTPSRSMTPMIPAVESLRELDSRPQTPTVVGLEKDEREEFLRRENELSDQLAEKESALAASEKLVKELREELTFLKEQETALSTVNNLFCLDIFLLLG
jgi:kinesin family member 5